jgi:hypothetical protein
VRVWGIASADDEETVALYAEQLGLSFPILYVNNAFDLAAMEAALARALAD